MSNIIFALALGVPILAAYVLIFALAREIGELYLRIDHLSSSEHVAGNPPQAVTVQALVPGEQAPSFAAMDMLGRPITVDSYLNGKPTALIFLSSTCSICREIAKHMTSITQEWQERGAALSVVGKGFQNEEFVSSLSPDVELILQIGSDAQSAFGFSDYPWLCIVSEKGVIAYNGHARSPEHVRKVLAECTLEMELV